MMDMKKAERSIDLSAYYILYDAWAVVRVSRFVSILLSQWESKIMERLGQALAGNAHPRCIEMFESLP